jgi:hypothetical protein
MIRKALVLPLVLLIIMLPVRAAGQAEPPPFHSAQSRMLEAMRSSIQALTRYYTDGDLADFQAGKADAARAGVLADVLDECCGEPANPDGILDVARAFSAEIAEWGYQDHRGRDEMVRDRGGFLHAVYFVAGYALRELTRPRPEPADARADDLRA